MRTIRLIAVSIFFAAVFAVSAVAQTPAAPDKIGLINWGAFTDSKAGITRFTTALAALDKEFEPASTELQTMSTRFQTLKTELEGYQKLVSERKPVPIGQAEIDKKVDEIGKIERDIKFKQEDAKARYQSRYGALVSPIENDILKALNEYAAQKGYALILDGAKLEQSNILLGFNQKADITKDFIAFYNARPATTATVPK
jgi:Skp family chaperone for outer membrane proteins